jgi:hypothetical protein
MTTPIEQHNTEDPGDATQRNYRYQYAYGVVLLVASVTKKKDYQAIWCEQQEDFLCEIEDGRTFDAVQVKTQQPESGYWQTNSAAFVNSIGRFVELDTKYPGAIRRFAFVSNTGFLDSNADTQASKSPLHLLRGVNAAKDRKELTEKALKAFEQLIKDTGANDQALFLVLKRLDLANGPSRDAFVAELALNHISQLDHCRDLNAGRLEDVTDAAIGLVERASSLSCQSPERHYSCLNRSGTTDPQLLEKRLSVDQFVLKCRNVASPDFRYLEGLTSQPLKLAGRDLKVFCAKLNRGGLEEQAEILRRQTLSAHAALIERAARDEDGDRVVTQIENIVLAECNEAQLRQATTGQPYGQKMMIDVQDRLKGLAKNEASRVHDVPYEILMGMSGLLTEECTVWWSDKFDVNNL